MTPLQALIDARALIAEPERWTQGAYARSKAGHVIGPSTRGAVCWCSVGALQRVGGEEVLEVLEVLARVAEMPLGNVFTWNDAPERTHAEVLAAFDAAIARLQEPTE